MTGFPLDDATLVMLAAACEINPDSGRTHLEDFLHMGAVEKKRKRINDDVVQVKYERGKRPFSTQDVIRSLVGEIQRLRAER